MSDIVIKVESVSKQYRLGKIGTGTFSHDINRWWHTVRGREDPYLKIGQVNDRSKKSESEYVWALQNISFDVKQGDVVGIIGKNGAGKSTLLKVLSRTTLPTTGSIKIKGRVASLLEVGTGFHPELTGRENIFLNGAILGMNKTEIRSKFDEIVDFSGVEKYVDTPVKRYSSGMYVRLAFAVAAHLEPEILIVDEVLAVGDAEFQKKAIGKMKDVSQGQGRTVLFVSHNLASVKTLCQKGLLLNNGAIAFTGEVDKTIEIYQNIGDDQILLSKTWEESTAPGNEALTIREIAIKPINGNIVNIDSGILITFLIMNNLENINLSTTLELSTRDEIIVFHVGVFISTNRDSKLGKYQISAVIPPFLLNANIYKLKLIFGESQRYLLFQIENIISFEVENSNTGMGSNLNRMPGIIRPVLKSDANYLGK